MAHLPHITHATATRVGGFLDDVLKPWLVAVVAAVFVIALAAALGAANFLSILDLIGSHR